MLTWHLEPKPGDPRTVLAKRWVGLGRTRGLLLPGQVCIAADLTLMT